MSKIIKVKRKELEILYKEPWKIGTQDRYLQEGIKYLISRLLNNEPLLG